MKFIIGFIAILCLNVQSLDLNSVRVAYKEAAHDKTKVVVFNKSLIKITKKDHVVLVAYKGASITLLGKYAKKIKDKKSLFIEGVELIEYTIKKAPNNIELRFIRLGIQENTPKILKYKSNIEEDKVFILEQYKYITSLNLQNHIKDYILQSNLFTTEEKTVISSH